MYLDTSLLGVTRGNGGGESIKSIDINKGWYGGDKAIIACMCAVQNKTKNIGTGTSLKRNEKLQGDAWEKFPSITIFLLRNVQW